MPEFLNRAHLDAQYLGEAAEGDSQVTVMSIDMNFVKTASAEVWVGDELTYTLTITNNELNPLTNVVITDTLDGAYVTYVTGSVAATINGTTATVSATASANVLTITLGQDIPAATGVDPDIEPAVCIITFRCTRA